MLLPSCAGVLRMGATCLQLSFALQSGVLSGVLSYLAPFCVVIAVLQELAAVSVVNAPIEQQPGASPACYMVASDLSAAPELAANAAADVANSQQCVVNSVQATLVNGLGWVVEEAQEVTNFTENNFAAVG
jgi:hypothetical protein